MHGSNTATIPIEVQVTGPHAAGIEGYAADRVRTPFSMSPCLSCMRESASPGMPTQPSSDR